MAFKSDNDYWASSGHQNRFQCIAEINSKIHDLNKSTRRKILNSEAISWITTGIKPDILDKHIKSKFEINEEIIQEGTVHIDDIAVKSSVLKSLHKSDKLNKLVFIYASNMDDSQKSRTRVLCRMIWPNLVV